MFGLRHCTWYNCLMRGSNGEEVEHQPNYLHLCPVCLRKLHWNIGFDIREQYAGLLEVFREYASVHEFFDHDCKFLQKRLSTLATLPAGATLISGLVLAPAASSVDQHGVLRAKAKAKGRTTSGSPPRSMAKACPPSHPAGDEEAGTTGRQCRQRSGSPSPAPGMIEFGWTTSDASTIGSGACTRRRPRSNSPVNADERSEELVRRLFDKHDQNHDGLLSIADLGELMETCGMPRKDAARLMKSADSDADGQLDVQDFITWVFSGNKHAVMALARISCCGA